MLVEIYRHFGASVNKYHKASYPRRSILHNHGNQNFKSPTDIAIAELSVLVHVLKHQSKIFALQRLVALFILHFNFVYSVFGKCTWPNPDSTFIQLGSLTRRKTKCDDSFIHLGFSSETNNWRYTLPGKSLTEQKHEVLGLALALLVQQLQCYY
jgi:hypothetical protein